MIITYSGDNYLKFQSGSTTVLIDPTSQRSFRGANLILNTMRPSAVPAPDEEDGAPFWIDHQGEYEVRDIRVVGWSTGNDGKTEFTSYHLLFDEIHIGILGHLFAEPHPELAAHFKDVDVLVLPGGGKPYLEPAAAAKLVRQLEPGIVIPTLTKDMKQFLKELGAKDTAPEEKLVFKKKEVVPKAMAVKLLSGLRPAERNFGGIGKA